MKREIFKDSSDKNDLYNTYTDRYNRNISYLLSLYVKAEEECIYHFNYLQLDGIKGVCL